jgi:hypothetical protein
VTRASIYYADELSSGDYARFLVDGRRLAGELHADEFGHLLLGDTFAVDSEGDPFPDVEFISAERQERLPTTACVIRAEINGIEHLFFGHDSQVDAPDFCRAGDGMTYRRAELQEADWEILWQEESA